MFEFMYLIYKVIVCNVSSLSDQCTTANYYM